MSGHWAKSLRSALPKSSSRFTAKSMAASDALARSGAEAVYVEILSKHGVRVPAPAKPEAEQDATPEGDDDQDPA